MNKKLSPVAINFILSIIGVIFAILIDPRYHSSSAEMGFWTIADGIILCTPHIWFIASSIWLGSTASALDSARLQMD